MSITGPANCTEIWQPLDVGIIANFKVFYRIHRARLDQLYASANVRWNDASTLQCTQNAWEAVKSDVVKKCFDDAFGRPNEELRKLLEGLAEKISNIGEEDDAEELIFYEAARREIEQGDEDALAVLERCHVFIERRRESLELAPSS